MRSGGSDVLSLGSLCLERKYGSVPRQTSLFAVANAPSSCELRAPSNTWADWWQLGAAGKSGAEMRKAVQEAGLASCEQGGHAEGCER